MAIGITPNYPKLRISVFIFIFCPPLKLLSAIKVEVKCRSMGRPTGRPWLLLHWLPPHSNPVCPDRALAVCCYIFASLRTLNHPLLFCTPPTHKVSYEATYLSLQKSCTEVPSWACVILLLNWRRIESREPRDWAQSQRGSKEQSLELQFHQALYGSMEPGQLSIRLPQHATDNGMLSRQPASFFLFCLPVLQEKKRVKLAQNMLAFQYHLPC